MAAVDRALGVVAQHAFAGEEVQVLDAFGCQLLVDLAQDGSFLRGANVRDAANQLDAAVGPMPSVTTTWTDQA